MTSGTSWINCHVKAFPQRKVIKKAGKIIISCRMRFLPCSVARALDTRSFCSAKCGQKTRAETSYSYSTRRKLKKLHQSTTKQMRCTFISNNQSKHNSQVGRCSCESVQPQWGICFTVRAGWSMGSLNLIWIHVQPRPCSTAGKAWIQIPQALSHSDTGDPNLRRWEMTQIPPAHAPAQRCCNTHPRRLVLALCSIICQSRKANCPAGRT